MMRFALVTSVAGGGSGAALEELSRAAGAQLVCVIYSDQSGFTRSRKKLLRKMVQIGPLGTATGLRLRGWFQHHGGKSLFDEAARLNIPVVRVTNINSDATIAALRDNAIDLGISLGNGYIASRVFTTPPEGFINYHGELLPEYPGALSIIWPIHDGLTRTGFTIHRIDKGIDTGPIVYRRDFAIAFRRTLRETVAATGAIVHPEMPRALRHVVENWPSLRAAATKEVAQRHFTTPTFWQYRRMVRNNDRLHAAQAKLEA